MKKQKQKSKSKNGDEMTKGFDVGSPAYRGGYKPQWR